MPQKGIVVLSGSIPKGVPDDIMQFLLRLQKEGFKTLLDAHGRFLVYGLKENPYAIKPNVFELESIVDRKLKDINDIVDAVKEIKDGNFDSCLHGKRRSHCFSKREDSYLPRLSLYKA